MTLFDSASLARDEASAEAGPGTSRRARRSTPGACAGPDVPQPCRADHADPGVDGDRADLVRLRLVVAYDGSGFRGFAAQEGQRTVAGELSRAVSTVAGHPVELVCAGRTDAGVHASGQVVHVDVRGDLSTKRLTKAVNSMLGPAIVVRSAGEAPPGFDARRSARARRYRYLVLRSDTPDPLLAPLAWNVRDDLDLRSMVCASDSLLGEHDFSAFCRRPPGVPADRPIVRRVLDARWTRLETAECRLVAGECLLRFDISAQSFAHQMVRSIVGTLVEVGRGKRPASDVSWLLRCGDRSLVKTIAPPHGLCLVGVDY